MVFGWCAWTGFDLWKDKPKAFTSAKIIFLAQIVNFTVPGFSFDGFYTGLRVYLMLSERARTCVSVSICSPCFISECPPNRLLAFRD